MNSQLPYWLVIINAMAPLFAAVSTLIIGLIAGYIAWRQWQTNKDKLRLDYYDRRFAVYVATRKFVANAFANGNVAHEELRAYWVDTRQAKFLFNESIEAYLNEISNHARHLQAVQLLMKSQAPEERRKSAADEWAAEKIWFADQHKVIDEKFRPFLQLRG